MNAAPDIQEALRLHRGGEFAEAARVYGEILAQDPSNVSVLRLLGIVHSQCGEYDKALMLLQAAARFAPDAPELYNDIGNALKGKEAYDEAICAYDLAIRINPVFAEAYFNRAAVYEVMGRMSHAEESYSLALQANTNLHEARINRAVIRMREKKFADVVEDLTVVRVERPHMVEAHLLYGRATQALGRWSEAQAAFRAAVACSPESTEAHALLGVQLLMQEQLDEAYGSLTTALQLNTRNSEALFHLGILHLRRYALDEAQDCFEQTVLLRPERPEVHVYLGITERRRGNLSAAAGHLERALSLDPGNADAHWHYADMLLLQGHYADGWAHFEWRWKHQGFLTPKWEYSEPVWKGEALEGRTIFLLPEQGFGDTIQFVRYAQLLKEQGATVLLGSPRELAHLLQSVPGVDRVVTTNREAPPFDVLCPLMSLPGLTRTTLESIPCSIPYISPDPALVKVWRERITDDGTLRVGIIWSGNALQENNRHRACTLADLAPLSCVHGTTFYSLQKGPPAAELDNPPPGMQIINVADQLSDFSDTAALLTHLDVLISTDTGPVHLAGALGRNVWLLVSAIPDWRWQLDSVRSPWYPSMRLFRQRTLGAWTDVVAKVCEALALMASEHRINHARHHRG